MAVYLFIQGRRLKNLLMRLHYLTAGKKMALVLPWKPDSLLDHKTRNTLRLLVGSYTANTSNLISLGSGIEFIGKPYMPLFIEYKYSFYDRKTTPFIFARGGKLYYVGQDEGTSDTNNMYDPKDFKGGFSCALGTGISWAKDDFETCLSFAYRYASTSYVQKDYNNYDATYKNSYNRLEVKLGFRF
jgi:hypothetical protein